MELFGHQNSTIPLGSFHSCLSKNVKIPPYRYGTFYLLVKKSSKLHRTVQKFSIFSSTQRQSPIQKTSKSYHTVRELLIFFSTNLQKSTVPLGVANLLFQKASKSHRTVRELFIFKKSSKIHRTVRRKSIFSLEKRPWGGPIPPYRYVSWNFVSKRLSNQNCET